MRTPASMALLWNCAGLGVSQWGGGATAVCLQLGFGVWLFPMKLILGLDRAAINRWRLIWAVMNVISV